MPTPPQDNSTAAEETGHRLDFLRIDLADPQVSVDKLDNGMIRILNPVVSRAGVFEYRNPDGSARFELRPPDEVFSPASMRSFANMPLTDMHPGLVTADNASQHVVGAIGDRLFRDRIGAVEVLRASSITVHDASAIESIRAGRNRLSLGYVPDIEQRSGTFDGHRFDAVQTNIRGNHVALVDVARAGELATVPRFDRAQVGTPATGEDAMAFVLQSGDSFQVRRGDPDWEVLASFSSREEAVEEMNRLHRRNDPRPAARGANALRRFREAQSNEDGMDDNTQVSGGEPRLDAMTELVSRLRDDLQKSNTERDTLQGLLDKANSERTDAADIAKQVAEQVQARFDLASKWATTLPDTFEVSKHSPDDIKRAVITAHLEGVDPSEWDGQRLDHSLLIIEKSSLSSAAASADRKAKVNGLRVDANAAANSKPAETPTQKAWSAQQRYASRYNGVPLGLANTRNDGGAK